MMEIKKDESDLLIEIIDFKKNTKSKDMWSKKEKKIFIKS